MMKTLIAAFALVLSLSAVGLAGPRNPTGAKFAKKHPRRAEVNRREKNQNKRINQGAKSGKLTKAQAHQLRAKDRAIKRQERADVKKNGGYVTKGEKRRLNKEENANSKKIRDEKQPAGQ